MTLAVVISGAALGCGSSTSKLDEDQIRPTLAHLPLATTLREVSVAGTDAAFLGTVKGRRGAKVDFAVSICGERTCLPDSLPNLPGGNDFIGATGWAFNDNGTAPGFGHTRKQGLALGSTVFLALCHAAHDDPCY
jgi:hypothetical protein